MGKLKLMTILGTRPEIIRLSAVIKCADKYFDHILVHTGQNYDYTLNEVFFNDLELRAPDYYLDSVGDNLGQTMGNILAKSYEVLQKEQPDALLILGDTNSALSAISAKRLKVPIFHMEAGNRCWDWNVPEMTNRTIVDHISDINLPYTEHSRRYLLSEGMDGKTIFVTGSPMREVLRDHADKIEQSRVLETLRLEPRKYILLSAHREENIDNEAHFLSLMFGFMDYNKLQKNAYCVLSDSGTLSEESAMLGFPAVLVRTSTERPEVLDKGTVVIGGIRGEDVRQAMDLAVAMYENQEETVMAEDYADTNVSVKVCKIIQSYAKIVNLTTWHKGE